MKIALDFDDTYTRDPQLWDIFILACKTNDHDIRIVTFRHKDGINYDLRKAIGDKIPVIYTGAHRKRGFCAAMGFFPDVWIDDMPEIIVADGYVPGEMLAQQLAYQRDEDE